MLRKFIIYFLYYVPLFKSFQVKAYNKTIIDNLQYKQLAIIRRKYWIKDQLGSFENLMPAPLEDFPENLVFISTDSKYYKYIHYVRTVLYSAFDREVLNAYWPKIDVKLIFEYLNTNLFKF